MVFIVTDLSVNKHSAFLQSHEVKCLLKETMFAVSLVSHAWQ